jgi:hypothetical protein
MSEQNPSYQVNIQECKSDSEIHNEQIASQIAQKYNLIYHQGDAVCTKTDNQLEDLKKARTELSRHMKVGVILWSGGVDNRYFFVFNSWEMPV